MNQSDIDVAVFEALNTPPKDLYSERKTHVGCGECCSRFLPLSKRELRVLTTYITTHNITLTPERADIDLLCPLLDENKLCKAYEARPFICRIYNCAFHKDNNFSTLQEAPLFIRSEPREITDLRLALTTRITEVAS